MVHQIKKRDWTQIVLLSTFFILLMLSYSTNFVKIAYDGYTKFDRPDELNVIGRLNKSAHEGIFSYGGLTGSTNYYPHPSQDSLIQFSDDYDGQIALQFEYYLRGIPIPGDTFVAYKTQTGGQAMLYSFIQKISPLAPPINLILFRLINASLIALCFVLFVGWVYRNYGLITGIVTALLIFITPLFATVSLSLWWCLWSYYIPFLTMLLLLEKRSRNRDKYSETKIFAALFIAVFAKCFFTGFEFMTTIMIAGICPIVYYCIAQKKSLKYSILFLFKAGIVSILAILTEMLVLITQIKMLMGTFQDGINHIVFSFFKRTTFHADEKVYTIGDVLKMYVIDSYPFSWNGASFTMINYGTFILLICALAVVIYFMTKKMELSITNKINALLGSTAFSVLSALSWLVIFKEHSALHIFIDPIVWYVPFMLFGYAVIGYAISLAMPSKNSK